jgi:hypothetical protein
MSMEFGRHGLLAGSFLLFGCSVSTPVGEFNYETTPDAADPDLEGDGSEGEDDGQRLFGDEDEARMISLDGVHANQGLEVELATDGKLLLPEERALDLIAERETLVTATWSTEPEFEAREIKAILNVFPPGQTSFAIGDIRHIEGGESDPDDLESAFNWVLTPGMVVPGTEFSVELVEVGSSMHGTPFSEVPPRLPMKGRGELAAIDGEMGIEVVLVPMRPEDGTFQIPTYWYEDFREQLYQFNPVQYAEVTMRAPVIAPVDATSSDLLHVLQNARIADEAADHVFYHGLFSPEFTQVGSNGSYWETTSAREDALYRVSTSEASTVFHSLHILGHNRGLQHVDGPPTCPVISGTDEDFPNIEGSIGTRGWGTLDGEFRSPHRTYDFMSFCQTVWVSDYHWGLQADYIRELSSWD